MGAFELCGCIVNSKRMNETLTKYQKAKLKYAEEEEFLKSELQKLLLHKNEILNNIYTFKRKYRHKGKIKFAHIGMVKKFFITKEETIYLLSKHRYIKSVAFDMHCVFLFNDIRKFIKSLK